MSTTELASARPRVSFTPGSIAGVVTARKRHVCDNHMDVLHHIERGDQHVANALPPDHPEIGNRGWWHSRYCLDCCPATHDPRTAEYGLRLAGGRVIRGPGWACEGDVIAASYPHGRRPGGDLVVRHGDGPWRTVRRLDGATS